MHPVNREIACVLQAPGHNYQYIPSHPSRAQLTGGQSLGSRLGRSSGLVGGISVNAAASECHQQPQAKPHSAGLIKESQEIRTV